MKNKIKNKYLIIKDKKVYNSVLFRMW